MTVTLGTFFARDRAVSGFCKKVWSRLNSWRVNLSSLSPLIAVCVSSDSWMSSNMRGLFSSALFRCVSPSGSHWKTWRRRSISSSISWVSWNSSIMLATESLHCSTNFRQESSCDLVNREGATNNRAPYVKSSMVIGAPKQKWLLNCAKVESISG